MAGKSSPDLYLSPNQQGLLLNALSSNTSNKKFGDNSFPRPNRIRPDTARSSSNPHQLNQRNGATIDTMSNSIFDSPQNQTAGFSDLANGDPNDSPFIDYDLDLDLDGNFDYDNNGQMIGSLPGTSPNDDGDVDVHDKRKSIDDYDDEEDGGGKRREGDDKTAKKPGRKPLTSEPTSKRKAQNRAAQRAFRERKERHLKDLETKVDDLEKASESANHENGLLRAQVDRLQTELREYRKRLSTNGSSLGRSPPLGGGFSLYPSAKNGTNVNKVNNFQFEFPRFGGVPGSHISNNGSLAKEAREDSNSSPTKTAVSYNPGVINRDLSPQTQLSRSGSSGISATQQGVQHLRNSSLENERGGVEGLSGLFSPSILKSVSHSPDYFSNNGNGTAMKGNHGSADSSDSSNSTSQLNGSSNHSSTASPSASSVSQHGPSSSCGTSPEPSNHSPTSSKPNENALNTINEEHVCHGNSDGEVTFCEKLSMACGNPNNPIPRALSMTNETGQPATTRIPGSEFNGINWMAEQNGGQFDPVLFGNYRDPQDAITSGDFGGFFDEAYPMPDFGSPFNINPATPAPKFDLITQIEEKQNGEEEVVPGEDTSKMLSCNKIWSGSEPSTTLMAITTDGTCTTGNEILDVGFGLTNATQNRDRLTNDPRFQDGSIDVDGLCTELRSKARCSETGVVVNQKDVDELIRCLPEAKATMQANKQAQLQARR
ncbi:MAG: DNA-binding transcription factor yap1 [Pycnora praestabilis]|nr:MAG: DNA-binding transcription factor yap1 [Pycnora praestabilis]